MPPENSGPGEDTRRALFLYTARVSRQSSITVGGVLAAGALGLLTSVGVAWTLVIKRPSDWTCAGNEAWRVPGSEDWLIRGTGGTIGRSTRTYMKDRPAEIDSTAIHLVPLGLSEPGARWHATRATGEPPGEANFVPMSNGQRVESFGLPWRCVRRFEWTSQGGCLVDTIAQRGVIRYGQSSDDTLPWWPEWGGLAGDTAAWGTPWLGVFVLAGRWRRARRRGRGLCLACGYSRAGLPAGASCPECGSASPSPGRRT